MLFRACIGLRRRPLVPCISHLRPQVLRPWSSSPVLSRTPTNEKLAQRRINYQTDIHEIKRTESGYHQMTDYMKEFLIKQRLRGSDEMIMFLEQLLRIFRNQIFTTRSSQSPSKAAEVALRSQRWKTVCAQSLNQVTIKVVTNPRVLPDIFFYGGLSDLDMYNYKLHRDRGRFSLQVAFELGRLDAAIALARHDLAAASPGNPARKNQLDRPEMINLPPEMVKHLRNSALAGTDWRTMTLYLDYSLRRVLGKDAIRENLEIANKLSTMVAPSNRPLENVPPLQRYELPWYLLEKASDQFIATTAPSSDNTKLKEAWAASSAAVEAGLTQWEDLRAIDLDLDYQESLPTGSDKWLKLTTQRAMEGRADACFALGDYYIRKEGWHPQARSPSTPDSRVGLWWLEASAAAALDDPKLFARRHLLISLLLHENRRHDEAAAVLARGVEALADQRGAGTETARRFLESYLSAWNEVDTWHTMPYIGKDWSATDKSMDLLKKEKLYLKTARV